MNTMLVSKARNAPILRWLGAAGVALAACAAPALGQRTALAMLDRIQPGAWELRARDAALTTSRLCLGDTRRLIQLRHPDAACDRFVIEDLPERVTVQYTCPGRGYGRTTIRRENAQIVQIETQGIADGLPFEFAAEARRIGNCAT